MDSTEKNILQEHAKLPQIIGATVSSLIAFNTGCLVGLPTSLLTHLEKEDNPDLRLQFSDGSWIASVYLIGGLPACLLGGHLSTLYGRRQCSIVASLPLFISWILLATAQSLPQILLGRLLSALSICSVQPSMGVFISETVHPMWRGSLGAFPSIFLALGITNVYLLGWLLTWRTLCLACGVWPIIMMLAFWRLPESPYWLVHSGQLSRARESLQFYRGEKYDIENEFVEILNTKQQSSTAYGGQNNNNISPEQIKRRGEASFCGVSSLRLTITNLTSTRFLTPFSIAGTVYVLAQWSGVSTMVFYMSHIFSLSTSERLDPMMASVIVAAIRVCSACLSSVLLRKASRRILFSACSVIISFSTFGLAACEYWPEVVWEVFGDYRDLIPLLLVIFMFIGHSLGVVPVCQLIAAEVFPMELRTMGTGICVSLATLANAANAHFYHTIMDSIGFPATFWLYSGLGMIMAVHGILRIPDTRNLSLATIEQNFSSKGTARKNSVQKISVIGAKLSSV